MSGETIQANVKPSPNFNDRPAGVKPSLIVMHGTGGTDTGDLAWLTNPDSKVSYHFLVQRSGTLWRLVEEDKRAWHAGVSEWEGRKDCNDYSIGIGLSAKQSEGYTDDQYIVAGILVGELLHRYRIGMSRVVAHWHISPGRKTDPWLPFEWGRLFEVASRTKQHLAEQRLRKAA